MLEFRREMQNPSLPANLRAPQVPQASQAARSQRSGLTKLQVLRTRFFQPTPSSAAPLPASDNCPPPPPTEDKQRVRDGQLQREAEAAVDAELEKYIRDGIVEGDALEDFDILQYWQVRVAHLIQCTPKFIIPGQSTCLPCYVQGSARCPPNASLGRPV